MKTHRHHEVHEQAAEYRAVLTPEARAALVRTVRAQHPPQPVSELRREHTATGSGRVRFAGLDVAPERPQRR